MRLLPATAVVGVLLASLLAPTPSHLRGSLTAATASPAVSAGACTSVSVTADKPSPLNDSTGTITFTATAGGCSSPLFQWWIWQAPSKGWVMLTDYLSSNTFGLNSAGLVAGTYSIDVWVENSGSSLGRGGYETFGLADFVIGACDSATLTPNPAPTTGVVHFSANATGIGCPTPVYEWWMYSTAAGWINVQPYSSSNIFDLDTATLGNTNYSVVVWSYSNGSAGKLLFLDTWAMSTVPKGACSSPSINAVGTSPQPVGTTVNFTTTAAGCTTPQFKYWIDPAPGGPGYPSHPGTVGTWQVLRDFSASGTFAWDSTGWKPGTYSIAVWVRNAGSTAPYDTYALLSYTVTGTVTAAVTTTPTSPHALGGAVTINATSTGSPAPQYEFFVYDKVTATWTTVQAYSPTASASWTPAHVGTYAIVVHVKQTGSGSLYDTYALASYSAT